MHMLPYEASRIDQHRSGRNGPRKDQKLTLNGKLLCNSPRFTWECPAIIFNFYSKEKIDAKVLIKREN